MLAAEVREEGELSTSDSDSPGARTTSHGVNEVQATALPGWGHSESWSHPGAGATKHKQIYYDIYGAEGVGHIEIKTKNRITLKDVQDLVLWITGEHQSPRWAFVKNKPLIGQVVLLLVNGINEELLQKHRACLPSLKSLGDPVVTLALNPTARPVDTTRALLNVPMCKKRKRQMELEEREGRKKLQGRPPFPPSHYLLSLKDMEANGYPVPVMSPTGDLQCPEGYVATQPPSQRGTTGGPQGGPCTENDSPMMALDCEMCITDEGYEVTRVTLVDEEGQVRYDELVLPDNPIIDYNTRFSGITEEMLKGCRTRLKDVQARFCELVSADTILVGHALENDLQALKVMHAKVLDTALLYYHPRGPPYKPALKVLTDVFLKKKIQGGAHDSVVDARCALELAKLKIRNGPSFGTPEKTKVDKLVDVLTAVGRRACLIDRPNVLSRYATGNSSAIPVASDRECAAKVGSQVKKMDSALVWAQLCDLSSFYHERAKHGSMSGGPNSRPEENTRANSNVSSQAGSESKRTGRAALVQDLVELKGSAPEQSHEVRWANHSVPEGQDRAGHDEHQAAKRKKVVPGCALDGPGGLEPEVPQYEVLPAAAPPGNTYSDQHLEKVLRRLDSCVRDIYEALPCNSALVLVTGQGDTAEIRRLQEQRMRRQRGLDNLPPWSQEDDLALNHLTDMATQALCYCKVKDHP